MLSKIQTVIVFQAARVSTSNIVFERLVQFSSLASLRGSVEFSWSSNNCIILLWYWLIHVPRKKISKVRDQTSISEEKTFGVLNCLAWGRLLLRSGIQPEVTMGSPMIAIFICFVT